MGSRPWRAQDAEALARVGFGRGIAEQARVGVARRVEHLGHGAAFDDAAEIHHHDPGAEPADHGEVVADEQEGEVASRLQLAHQHQDLRLDGDVEGGDRLVGDQQFRLDREGAGDADALALAAGEFMREAVERGCRQADLIEQRRGAGAGGAAAGEAVHFHRLDQGLADGAARVERGVRVLEDDLHAGPQRGQRGAARGAHVGAGEADAAGVGLDEAEHGACGGRLAAAGFADHADGLARTHVDIDAVDGVNDGGDRADHAWCAARSAW